ncbi:hypothetical protein NLU13_9223 [Sarocladium strictum]|uniref:VPS37 C-terminal domain-containing protein n=1 Tax=Sarocladium strictum TaxID=5046 RepID=A0AA39G9R5_SARSR|nr:hypothetical protein NLU13_9223 [Sarocladium strictum]
MTGFPPDNGPAATPPVPPPKPGSHEASGISTPVPYGASGTPGSFSSGAQHGATTQGQPGGQDPGAAFAPEQQASPIPEDPGEHWLPHILEDKSKQDLAAILSDPKLLQALVHSPSTAHPSTTHSNSDLLQNLTTNASLAQHLTALSTRLAQTRAATQSQLLSTHSLERTWRSKQSDMDHALAPFSPASLYQRLGQGVQEQAAVCQAMEESFLDGGGRDGDGEVIGEREVGDWVKKYREARVQYYLRQERKERWDEGRVGGWR